MDYVSIKFNDYVANSLFCWHYILDVVKAQLPMNLTAKWEFILGWLETKNILVDI